MDDVLRALGFVLAPLLRLLLASGANYPRLIAEIKPLILEQARLELLRRGQEATDSALSALSGVHRKDVRVWREGGLAGRVTKELSISSQVFARWLQDPSYRDRRRRARPLARLGPKPSFESLVRSVTRDVHPYTVLVELLRLGLVNVQTSAGREEIVPVRDGFIPPPGSREMLELFGANLADHGASAVNNLLGAPALLEQSVFAEGITAESAQALGLHARKLWSRVRADLLADATRRYEAEHLREDANHRFRFGAYFHAQRCDVASPGPRRVRAGDRRRGERDGKK